MSSQNLYDLFTSTGYNDKQRLVETVNEIITLKNIQSARNDKTITLAVARGKRRRLFTVRYRSLTWTEELSVVNLFCSTQKHMKTRN